MDISAAHHAHQPMQKHKADAKVDGGPTVHQRPGTHVDKVAVRNGQQDQLRQEHAHHLHQKGHQVTIICILGLHVAYFFSEEDCTPEDTPVAC